MSKNRKKCGGRFVTDDGDDFTCDREGRHVVHSASGTSMKAVHALGVTVVSGKKSQPQHGKS